MAATIFTSSGTPLTAIVAARNSVAGDLEEMCQQLRFMVERLRIEHQEADKLQEEKRLLEKHVSDLQNRVSEVRDNGSHAQAEVEQLRTHNSTLEQQLKDARNTIKILHQEKEVAENYVERLAGMLESRPPKRNLQTYLTDADCLDQRTKVLPLPSGGSSTQLDSSTSNNDELYDGGCSLRPEAVLLDSEGTSLTDEIPPSSEFGSGQSVNADLYIRGQSSGRDSCQNSYGFTPVRSTGNDITSNIATPSTSLRKVRPLERRLVCHRCFIHGLSCDNDTICGHCDAANTECTRSLCTDYWRKGCCYWKRCLRVHDEQGYNAIKLPLERNQRGKVGGLTSRQSKLRA